jgi:hypothetical protein
MQRGNPRSGMAFAAFTSAGSNLDEKRRTALPRWQAVGAASISSVETSDPRTNQAMAAEGGPRTDWLRSMPGWGEFAGETEGSAPVTGADEWASHCAGVKAGVVEAAMSAGNCGQRDGALRAWPSFCGPPVSASIAQWCTPWRRQQNGRRVSSIPGRIAAKGPSQRSRISEMESPRRIANTRVSTIMSSAT